MNVNNLYQRIKNLDEQGIASRKPESLAELRDLYFMAFNQSVADGCGDCVRKAYGKLQLLTLNRIQEMVNSKFKLKQGFLLQQGGFGSGNFITNDNLTDKIAYKELTRDPQLIKYFDEYPKDDKGNLLAQKEEEKSADQENTVSSPLLDGKSAEDQLDALKEEKTPEDLEDKTREELGEVYEQEVGKEAPASWSKKKVTDAIVEHRSEQK